MKVEAVTYVLWVQDMDRAVAFYRNTLGLGVKSASPRWTELSCNRSTVALHSGGGGTDTPTGLSFQVPDIYGACMEIEESGGQIVEPPHARPGEPIRLARVTDPEGNEFSLTQWDG